MSRPRCATAMPAPPTRPRSFCTAALTSVAARCRQAREGRATARNPRSDRQGWPVKTPEQQSTLVLHRTRAILMRQRIQLSNAIRGHMAEFGIVAPIGRKGLERLLEVIRDEADERVPAAARACLQMLADQLRLVNIQALETDRRIRTSARATEVGRRLMGIPGVGPLARERPRRHHPCSASLPLGPEPGCLDRPGAEAELKRRQGAARRDYQAR